MFFDLVLYAVFNVLPASLSCLPDVFHPNGDGEIRTHDPLLARQVLSQLSYTPVIAEMTGISSIMTLLESFLHQGYPLKGSGSHLLSHAVSSIVPSAV